MKIEYQVRPITRFQVTRYEESDDGRSGSVSQKGEYDNAHIAYEVGYALCKEEHGRLGYPITDERIKYPEQLMFTAKLGSSHASDCALHNEPAMPNEPCSCGAI